MRTNLALRCGLAALTASILMASAGDNPRGDALTQIPERLSIELRAISTRVGGADNEAGSAGPGIAIGETGTAYILAGAFDGDGRPERTLCLGGVGSSEPRGAARASAAHMWHAAFKVLSATMESITFTVDWSRETAGRPGAFERAAGNVRTLTLREGEHHTLDFLVSPDPYDPCGTGLRIDVSASVVEDPGFFAQRIAYDLWLLDEAPGQPAVTRRFESVGRQGETVGFSFPQLRWAIPGVMTQNGSGVEAIAAIDGTIRGRVREDGEIDLLLDANRGFGAAKAGSDRTGGIGDHGRKTLRIPEGETLGLVLPGPAPAGAYTLALDGTWTSSHGAAQMTSFGENPGPASGVEVSPKSVTVNFARFLAGHKMSLRLTARLAGR